MWKKKDLFNSNVAIFCLRTIPILIVSLLIFNAVSKVVMKVTNEDIKKNMKNLATTRKMFANIVIKLSRSC